MPLLVPCEDLQPGMRLAEAFFHRDRMMLAGDTVLTVEDIRGLRARFLKHSFRVVDPLLDAVIEFEDDAHEREVARTSQRRISECMAEVNARFSQRASLCDVNITSIQEAALEVIRYLEANPVSAALVENFMGGEGYLSEHAGNVFYLSMLLGIANPEYVARERQRQSTARELDAKVLSNLVPLGLGAMLLDLGMLPLQHLFTEDAPLTPELWRELGEHPIAGADVLPEEFPSVARTVVRTHHENVDGTGYPAALAGDRLHVFTRVVRIADAYDAATARRVFKEAKSPVRVLWEMSVGPYRRCYDERLMATFARLMQPFPIGSKIRLRNGQYAVVVKYNRSNPVAPLAVVAFDEHNRRLPNDRLKPPLRLGSSPGFQAESFGGEELSFIYDEPVEPLARTRVGVWPSLFEAAYP